MTGSLFPLNMKDCLFCFICGCLGHSDRCCSKLFTVLKEEITRGWGAWLKAPVRRNIGSGFNPWLLSNKGHQLEKVSDWNAISERGGVGVVMEKET